MSNVNFVLDIEILKHFLFILIMRVRLILWNQSRKKAIIHERQFLRTQLYTWESVHSSEMHVKWKHRPSKQFVKLSWAKSFKMATLIFHSWLGGDLGQFQEKENEIRARREGWDGEMILHFQAELWTLLRDKKTNYIYLCWILIYRHATSVHNIIHFPETVLVMKCYLHPH